MNLTTKPFLIKPYKAPNWFTEEGVWLKQKQIENKGLPDLKNSLFITLTLDPLIGNEKDTFELGKERFRRFLAYVRDAIGQEFPWARKLEFQENGYAHWHLILVYKKKIPQEFLYLFNKWWGLGRVNVKRLRYKDFKYLFKYVSKVPFSDVDESGVCLPSWALDYSKTTKDGRKSTGIRFWQTGGGFYTDVPPKREATKKEKQSSRIPLTIREQIQYWERKVTVYFKGVSGFVSASERFLLKVPWGELNKKMISQWLEGNAALYELTWICRINQINEFISLWIKKKINKMLLKTLNLEMAYSSEG